MKERNVSFDLLKILACFLVIVNHSSAVFIQFSGLNSSWVLATVTFFIAKTAVPLFMMVSGALLLNRQRSYTYSFTKAGHFFLLLLIWDYGYWLLGPRPVAWWRLDAYLQHFFAQPAAIHLWYLYMLVGFYLMLPFISRLTANFTKKDFEIFLGFWIGFGTTVPFFQALLHFHISPYFQLPLYMGFLGYFVLGRYLFLYPPRKMWLVLVGLISLVVVSGLTISQSLVDQRAYLGFDNVLFLPVVLIAITLFGLIAAPTSPKQSAVLAWISQLTFGIYLSHFVILHTIVRHLEPLIPAGGLLKNFTYLLIDALVFIVAGALTWVLQHIKPFNRLVS
ncbi:acyltransferase [Lacticaseibacillus brantae]|nr:acyltransferase family protein [Lacticaseibacillus brantae]